VSDAGYGYGYSNGTGTGYGYGHGLGYGFGYGSGSGLGYGFGYGSGYIIAKIGGHDVCGHTPFAVVSVGCETHTIDHWRNDWREIAREHSADVSREDVEKILMEVSCE